MRGDTDTGRPVFIPSLELLHLSMVSEKSFVIFRAIGRTQRQLSFSSWMENPLSDMFGVLSPVHGYMKLKDQNMKVDLVPILTAPKLILPDLIACNSS